MEEGLPQQIHFLAFIWLGSCQLCGCVEEDRKHPGSLIREETLKTMKTMKEESSCGSFFCLVKCLQTDKEVNITL